MTSTLSVGKELHKAIERHVGSKVCRTPKWLDMFGDGQGAFNDAASEFLAPYLARIAEIEADLAMANARADKLESELARIKAENAALRDATVIKPGETIVFVAPEHVSENGLLEMFGDFYRKHADLVIVLAHDWRTLPIDELRKLLAGAS